MSLAASQNSWVASGSSSSVSVSGATTTNPMYVGAVASTNITNVANLTAVGTLVGVAQQLNVSVPPAGPYFVCCSATIQQTGSAPVAGSVVFNLEENATVVGTSAVIPIANTGIANAYASTSYTQTFKIDNPSGSSVSLALYATATGTTTAAIVGGGFFVYANIS